MSFFKSIKNAFGSDSDDYDVYGQPTTFVNPFSKDKNVPDHDHHDKQDDVRIEVDLKEEYALDAEFADKAARLMNEHTQAVIDMLKGNWKQERENLMKMVEEAKKSVEESKEKMQVNEANRRQAQTKVSDLMAKVAELEAEQEKMDIEKKSLESRLKAMEVKGEGAEDLDNKVEQLNATVEELQQQVAEKDAELQRLNEMMQSSEDGPSVEELSQSLAEREAQVETLQANVNELEEKINAANEELSAAEKAFEQLEEYKEKKNAEITSLRQQVSDMQKRTSEFDEMRKANIVLTEENENLQKSVEQLEASAKQNAEVQNRRSIETGNTIDGLKSQLASMTAMAEDFKRKYNSLSVDGNEKAANFAKISAERDDAKAELKRTQVTLQKKQHEAQAMNDAIVEKDRRIAALMQQIEELKVAQRPMATGDMGYVEPLSAQDDPTMGAIDDIDWADDGSMPPHPGEDPRQLSLF